MKIGASAKGAKASCPSIDTRVSYSGAYNTQGGVLATDNYIFTTSGSGGTLSAISFNGTSFTDLATLASVANANSHMWFDGTYLYVPSGSTTLKAYTFNGTAFTLAGTYTAGGGAIYGVYGYGSNIYTAGNNRLEVLTFNGTTFSVVATKTGLTTARRVWANASGIYVISNGDLQGYTLSGSTLTLRDTYSFSANVVDVWGDSSYIYVTGDYTDGIKALTFSGTAFTEVYTTYDDFAGSGFDVWAGGDGFAYTASGNGIQAFKPNGGHLTLYQTYSNYGGGVGVSGNTNYVFETDSTFGLMAIARCR